eukprot:NODE_1610_length_1102_cov_315.524355.p2 GENE.NODE_1610_length_1102_cov_315.524355~~NODE_1610_length_1102_cov_315.524355.p2  ORF type:complete len:236 (+),score=20.48 NODE_1610_length_1102_cov_315.524355:3-710(+)
MGHHVCWGKPEPGSSGSEKAEYSRQVSASLVEVCPGSDSQVGGSGDSVGAAAVTCADAIDSEASGDADVHVAGASSGSNAKSNMAARHAAGTCKPCHFVGFEGGCSRGDACHFCHLPHLVLPRPRPSKSARLRSKRMVNALTVDCDDPKALQTTVLEMNTQSVHALYRRGVLDSVLRQRSKVPSEASPQAEASAQAEARCDVGGASLPESGVPRFHTARDAGDHHASSSTRGPWM